MVTRSPNYPSLDLAAAIEAVRPVFKAEHRNKMSRAVLAKHLGYSSLNGRALSKIGAVRAYGLVEGNGDEQRVTDDAVHVLMAPNGSSERQEAMERCALRPPLFREIRADFPNSHPSEQNLRYWLVKNNYTPDAAGKAADTYLATMRLVGESLEAYTPPAKQEDKVVIPGVGEVDRAAAQRHAGIAPDLLASTEALLAAVPPAGTRREVVTLDEGDVVITFPEALSAESFADLKDHLDLFIKKMQRRASKRDEPAN